jgi:hypothetical protein
MPAPYYLALSYLSRELGDLYQYAFTALFLLNTVSG